MLPKTWICPNIRIFEHEVRIESIHYSCGVSFTYSAGVLEEARFFGISKAVEPLELLVQSEELALSGHFTRKEFLRMLSITSSSATLRCQVCVCISVCECVCVLTFVWYRVSTLRKLTCQTLTFETSILSVPTFVIAISPTATFPIACLSELTCTTPILM